MTREASLPELAAHRIEVIVDRLPRHAEPGRDIPRSADLAQTLEQRPALVIPRAQTRTLVRCEPP